MILLLCLLLAWNGYITYELFKVKDEESNLSTESNVTVLNSVLTDITELVSVSEPKVVSVVSKSENETINSGSGSIYKSDDNGVYIITNAHVINNSDTIEVTFINGEVLIASLVGKDDVSDIAVLLTTPEFNVETFKVGVSSNVKKGEYVLAIGSPLQLHGSVSFGIISGIDRSIGLDQNNDGNIDWEVNVLQTDAAINPGNSGGPLVNLNGELIGINAIKVLSSSFEGLGFAIGSDDVVPIVERLIEKGEIIRPYLGMKVKDISHMTIYQKSFYGISLDMTDGIYINELMVDGLGYLSGLRNGDIIVEINKTQLKNEKDFSKIIYALNVGDEVNISYFRNNELFNITMVLQ